MTETKFSRFYESLLDYEKEESVLTKVRGFFSFVNLMWFFGIVGILATVIPCVVVLCQPCLEFFLISGDLIFKTIVVPLHHLGVYELFCYIACAQFISEGLRFNIESGFYIGLIGILGVTVAMIYSFNLHSPLNDRNRRNYYYSERQENHFMIVYGIINGLTLIPFSIYYESTLLAWFVTIIFYTCLGFSVIPFYCGLFIGFEDEDAIGRNVITATIFGIAFMILKALKVSNLIINIYQQPLTVFSSVSLFLGLLIYSSHFYRYYDEPKKYILKQLLFLGFILAFLLMGFTLGLEGLTNTALTFFVIYSVEKYVEFHDRHQFDKSILVLVISSAVYGCSLFLHSRKNFIASLFSYYT